MNATIITIGDEILLGQIVDTNSAWIAQQLLPMNIRVNQILSISDQPQAIRDALDQAKSQSDLILVTGGLGPTKDDVTKETIASYFSTRLVRDETVLAHVKEIFRRFNREMPKMNEAQADVLECGEVLFNDWGTAPGIWVDEANKHYVFLPGVPFEMKNLIAHRVFPKLNHYYATEKIKNQYILTVGLGESHLAEMIVDIEESLPLHIKLAYLPKIGLVRLRLTGVGKDDALLNEELNHYSKQLAKRLARYVVAMEDVSFEEAIVRRMTGLRLSLGTAESCTGGNIARQITEIPDSSAVFKGSVVAYSNEIKMQILGVENEILEQHGAVSEPTIIQMAEGARKLLNVDYAIATSGIAGPGGGTLEKPVGMVWIAVASANGTITKRFQFHNDRLVNIERATSQALLMLWSLL